MEQEIYKTRSVSSCIKAAYDTVCNNAKTIICSTWIIALINAAVAAALPIITGSIQNASLQSALMIIPAVATEALLFAKTGSLLNGRQFAKNFKRFLLAFATLSLCTILAGIIISLSFLFAFQSTPTADHHGTLKFAVAVAIAAAAIIAILLLPTSYSCMNYLYSDKGKWSNIFGYYYTIGFRHWGYLFMLHLLLGIIISVLITVLTIIPVILMIADFKNAESMALGDADALPNGFKLIYYLSAMSATFLTSYVMIWAHIAIYYAYGTIETKRNKKQTQDNDNE